jgi:glucose-1-phosphate thymidylyltransferase
MDDHGLLLAAGRGTRLSRGGNDVPKALVRVGDETLVEHNLRRLVEAGIEHVAVVVGHLAGMVVEHLDAGPYARCVEYVTQAEPLGTGHAVSISREALRGEPFVMCYCDNYTPYRLDALLAAHRRTASVATLAVFHAENPSSHGILQVEGERVVKVVERPREPVGDLAFAGMAVFEREIYDAAASVRRSDKGEYYLTDAVDDLVRAGRPVGYDVLDCLRININSPEQLDRARAWQRAQLD